MTKTFSPQVYVKRAMREKEGVEQINIKRFKKLLY